MSRRLHSRSISALTPLKSNRATPYALVAPVVLLLSLVILIPVLYTLFLSFFSYTFTKPLSYVGIANYIKLFSDPNFIRALVNNVIFVNIVVYGELLFGIGFALFFVGPVPFKKIMISIVMAPYAVSAVLGVLMWRFLWQPDIGIINAFLSRMGMPQLQWASNPVDAFVLIILLEIWLNVPFTFLIIYNSLLGLDQQVLDSALVDGASPWQTFIRIKLPMIMPAIIVSLMFRYIFAFRTFDVVWILTGGGPYRSTELLAVYLYRQTFSYYQFGEGAAVAWVMVVVTVLIAAYYFRVMYKRMFKNA